MSKPSLQNIDIHNRSSSITKEEINNVVSEFGTPLYVIDEQIILNNLSTLENSFNNYNGNPIFLYDDGTGVDGSGDSQKGDGSFTRTISMTENAITGTYHWTFEAQDLSNAYSQMVKKVLVVQ